MSTNWSKGPGNMDNNGNRVGLGAISGSNLGIFDVSDTADLPIGAKREFEDGRIFRFSEFAADTTAGHLVAQDVSAQAVTYATDDATAASIGDKSVTLTDSTLFGSSTANQFAGGYLHTVNDAGQGYTYRIKSNTAGSSNATTLTLFDGLKIALTTASDVVITGSPYNGLVSATAATDMWVAGVCINAMDVSDKNYGWIQTRGYTTVLYDAGGSAVTIGDQVRLSDGTAGAVQQHDTLAVEQIVGYALHVPNADADFIGVYLQLE